MQKVQEAGRSGEGEGTFALDEEKDNPAFLPTVKTASTSTWAVPGEDDMQYWLKQNEVWGEETATPVDLEGGYEVYDKGSRPALEEEEVEEGKKNEEWGEMATPAPVDLEGEYLLYKFDGTWSYDEAVRLSWKGEV